MYRLGKLVVLKLGSHGGSARGFRWVFHIANFSTQASSGANIMVDYLMTSLGFSEEEAIATSSKVRAFKSPERPASVIGFFEESGLDKPQIKKIIYEAPKILSCDLEKTIKPRVRVLQDLGLSGSDLAMAISANRQIWRAGFNSFLMPTFQYLKTILSDETVSKVLMKSPFLLHHHTWSNRPAIVALLQEYGFSSDNIEDLMLKKPRLFMMDPKRVHDILVKVEEKLQICRTSPGFFVRFCILTSMTEKTIESKIETYKSFGFTESDIWALARKIPTNLKLSEATIRARLNFYMKVLGFDPSYLVAWPILLNLNLERRIMPRYAFMKALEEKGLLKTDYSLAYYLSRSESQFVKFVLSFKDKVPDLCENYIRSMGSHLHTQDAQLTTA